jgi:hypothetical protein
MTENGTSAIDEPIKEQICKLVSQAAIPVSIKCGAATRQMRLLNIK